MITQKKGHIIFDVKVNPYSRENKIELIEDDVNIKIKAIPAEGRANKALVKFLSALLSIPTNNISIVGGLTSRNKIIKIGGILKGDFLDTIKRNSYN